MGPKERVFRARDRMNDPELTWQIETDPVLRLILNSITDQAVFTLDPEGAITTWNEGCRRIKQHTYEEAIGEHFRMLYTPEDQAERRPERNLQIAFETGERHEEWVRMRKDGERYVANVSIYRLDKDGGHVGFAKVVRDVTARRRLEADRRDFEARLERSNAELQGLYDALARRLSGPLGSIVEDSRLVRESAAESLPPESIARLESVVLTGRRLERLADDLLAFARQEVDASELARRLAIE